MYSLFPQFLRQVGQNNNKTQKHRRKYHRRLHFTMISEAFSLFCHFFHHIMSVKIFRCQIFAFCCRQLKYLSLRTRKIITSEVIENWLSTNTDVYLFRKD